MWILEYVGDSATDVAYLLFVGDCQYTVGRRSCDVLLRFENDPSLSRRHAMLTVRSVDAEHIGDYHHVPQFCLSDMSKHGTYVDGVRCYTQEAYRNIDPVSQLRFGMREATYVLNYMPIIAVMDMNLSKEEREVQAKCVARLGGAVVDSAIDPEMLKKEGVAPLMLLFITDILVPQRQLTDVLVYGYQLVNTGYLPRIAALAESSCELPLEHYPHPSRFDAGAEGVYRELVYSRPDPIYYGPSPNSFFREPKRDIRRLFGLLWFLFTEEDMRNSYLKVMERVGVKGAYVPWREVVQWGLEVDEERNEFLPLQGLVPQKRCHGLNTVVLVPAGIFAELRAAIKEGATEEMLDRPVASYVMLWELGCYMVHEYNVHFAMYAGDAASHFNPTSTGVLKRERNVDATAGAAQAKSDSSERQRLVVGDAPTEDTDSDATVEEGQSPHEVKKEKRRRGLLGRSETQSDRLSTTASTARSPRSRPKVQGVVLHEPEQLVVLTPRRTSQSPMRSKSKSPPPARDEPPVAEQPAEDQPMGLYDHWMKFRTNTRATTMEQLLDEMAGEASTPQKEVPIEVDPAVMRQQTSAREQLGRIAGESRRGDDVKKRTSDICARCMQQGFVDQQTKPQLEAIFAQNSAFLSAVDRLLAPARRYSAIEEELEAALSERWRHLASTNNLIWSTMSALNVKSPVCSVGEISAVLPSAAAKNQRIQPHERTPSMTPGGRPANTITKMLQGHAAALSPQNAVRRMSPARRASPSRSGPSAGGTTPVRQGSPSAAARSSPVARGRSPVRTTSQQQQQRVTSPQIRAVSPKNIPRPASPVRFNSPGVRLPVWR